MPSKPCHFGRLHIANLVVIRTRRGLNDLGVIATACCEIRSTEFRTVRVSLETTVPQAVSNYYSVATDDSSQQFCPARGSRSDSPWLRMDPLLMPRSITYVRRITRYCLANVSTGSGTFPRVLISAASTGHVLKYLRAK